MIASLPMYDWPEVREHTNALWSTLQTHLLQHQFATPDELRRDLPREQIWQSEDLLLSQTCGLPYTRGLCGDALLLGSPVYDLPHCEAGDYFSVVVVRADEPATSLTQLRGHRVAFNAADSQSGHAAMLFAVAPLARAASFFASSTEVGTHRAAIQAVASGDADVAAIDAVSWRLAEQHEPAAKALRILMRTAPSPGLPFISARSNEVRRENMNKAISNAIAALAKCSRDALHLRGFRPRPASDYALLTQRIEHARALGCARLA